MENYLNQYMVNSQIQFDAADPYRQLSCPPRGCVRQSQTGFAYSERHLQCIWFDRKLRPETLTTRDGEPIRVISPGRWNLEAGPDFLDATLEIGGSARRQIRGDVEIHVHADDWNHHGHSADSRYNHVIAHVTFRPSATPKGLPTGAVAIPLADALAADPAFSMESIDLAAYPYAANAATNCPCATILETWHPDRIIAVLETAGAFRIEQKAARMVLQLRQQDVNTLFYSETMAALGYKQNATAFRQLAARITPEVLQDLSPLDAYALLLGVAGLLPASPSSRWSDTSRSLLRQLWDAWWRFQTVWSPMCMQPNQWTLVSLRPQNHPTRRLAAAATLFAGRSKPLWQCLLDEWQTNGSLCADQACFQPQPPLDFWLYHLGFGGASRKKPMALIGDARHAAWMTNVIVPLLAASGENMTALLPQLPPEQINSVMREAAYRLLGSDHNPALYAKNGLRQQGLMQIFHYFCLAERAGCATCNFAEAIAKVV